jgi:hypothetical protein
MSLHHSHHHPDNRKQGKVMHSIWRNGESLEMYFNHKSRDTSSKMCCKEALAQVCFDGSSQNNFPECLSVACVLFDDAVGSNNGLHYLHFSAMVE